MAYIWLPIQSCYSCCHPPSTAIVGYCFGFRWPLSGYKGERCYCFSVGSDRDKAKAPAKRILSVIDQRKAAASSDCYCSWLKHQFKHTKWVGRGRIDPKQIDAHTRLRIEELNEKSICHLASPFASLATQLRQDTSQSWKKICLPFF